jgi:hypothetical protein
MAASGKSVTMVPVVKTWGMKTGIEKTVFVVKVCIMVCSFGFLFGGVLVEGMTYEELERY